MILTLESYLRAAGARESSGGEWVMGCPFCGKRGHLYVNVDAREVTRRGERKTLPAGRWTCFKCNEGSFSFPVLMMELEGFATFDEAKRAYQRLRIGVPKWRSVKELPEPEIAPAAPEEVPRWISEMVPEYIPVFDGAKWNWPLYLSNRKGGPVPRTLAARFNIGYAKRGRYADRIIIPLDSPLGRGFTARSIHPEAIEPMRYLSSTMDSALVFGWSSVAGATRVVLNEGSFDSLRVLQAALPGVGAIGLLTKTLRDEQADMLASSRARWFTLMLDGELAVKEPKSWRQAIEKFSRLPGRLDVALLSGAKDPGEATTQQIKHALAGAAPPERALNRAFTSRAARYHTMR